MMAISQMLNNGLLSKQDMSQEKNKQTKNNTEIFYFKVHNWSNFGFMFIA